MVVPVSVKDDSMSAFFCVGKLFFTDIIGFYGGLYDAGDISYGHKDDVATAACSIDPSSDGDGFVGMFSFENFFYWYWLNVWPCLVM